MVILQDAKTVTNFELTLIECYGRILRTRGKQKETVCPMLARPADCPHLYNSPAALSSPPAQRYADDSSIEADFQNALTSPPAIRSKAAHRRRRLQQIDCRTQKCEFVPTATRYNNSFSMASDLRLNFDRIAPQYRAVRVLLLARMLERSKGLKLISCYDLIINEKCKD